MNDANPNGPAAQPAVATRPRYGIGLTVVIVGLLVSGVAHGYLDGRWAFNRDLEAFGNGLDELPERVGTWSLARRDELAANAQRILRCHGSLVREYVDDASGRRVSVAVLFGPRGPIAVHTPEICYSSVGTKVAGPTEAVTLEDVPGRASFWKTEFIQTPETEPSFEVWYGWSDGGDWVAAKNPRFWMTDQLFKIQLAGPVSGDDSGSAIRDFLNAFLPELNQYLSTF